MTENDKFMLKAFFEGFAFPAGILSAVIIVIVMLSGGKDETLMKPQKPTKDVM